MKRFTRTIAIIQLLLIGLLFALMFSCKAKQKSVEKNVEKVSEIVQNDIKKTTKTELDVTVVEISEKKQINIEPVEKTKPTTVVFSNGDTITVANGKISIGKEKTIVKTTDKTQTKTRTKDKTETETNTETKQKTKNKDVKGGFPWWILIVIGLGFLVWKAAGKLPGV